MRLGSVLFSSYLFCFFWYLPLWVGALGRWGAVKNWRVFGGMFNILRGMKGTLVLPMTLLPTTKVLLTVNTTLRGPTLLRLTPFLSGDKIRVITRIVRGTKSVIFTGLPILFTINMTINLTNNRNMTTLTTVVNCLVVGIAVKATTKVATRSMGKLGCTGVLKVPALRANMFNNVVINVVTTTLCGGFFRVRLPSCLNFFTKGHFIPVVATTASMILNLLVLIV